MRNHTHKNEASPSSHMEAGTKSVKLAQINPWEKQTVLTVNLSELGSGIKCAVGSTNRQSKHTAARRHFTTMSYIFLIGQIVGVFSISAVLLFLLAKLVSRQPLVMPDSEGYAVLITGCDSGFGHQLARCLDHRGFVVFAGCLCPEGAGALSLQSQSSRNLKILKLDVTSDEDVQLAKKTVQENLPERGLWAVVNNAGISDWAEIEWSTIDDFRHMVDVNLFGCIRTSIAFLPLVRAAKGRMIFVSSIFAFFNCLTMGAYSVSKRGLEAFADCLRVEMASFDVKVSIIQPGNFGQATNIVKLKTAHDIWEKLDEDRRRRFNQQYIKLANEYFLSTCKSGFTNSDRVINTMLHAVMSAKPKYRYLLVSSIDMCFFKLFPYLPTVVTDAVFTLSSMYTKRKQMLYAE